MVLKFRNRKTEPSLKKVMIYGLDGSGKSTFAEQYCRENNLHPVVLDIDDTNYTSIPSVELDFSTDIKTYNSIKSAIQELSGMEDFDTIILDGVTSLLEMLVSNSKGMSAYSDRSKRWNSILRTLLASKKNIIFIGQIDMEVIYTTDAQSSKAVIKVNSLVNEKYYCYIDKQGNYLQEVKKLRTITIDELEAEAKETNEHKPKKPVKPKKAKPSGSRRMDDAEEIAASIIMELPERTILAAKMELAKLLKDGIIAKEECEPILKELEKQL